MRKYEECTPEERTVTTIVGMLSGILSLLDEMLPEEKLTSLHQMNTALLISLRPIADERGWEALTALIAGAFANEDRKGQRLIDDA